MQAVGEQLAARATVCQQLATRAASLADWRAAAAELDARIVAGDPAGLYDAVVDATELLGELRTVIDATLPDLPALVESTQPRTN